MAQVGSFHHADGSSDLALAEKEKEGEGLKVVVFPEPGGTFEVHHNVATGTEDGEFSS